MGHASRAVRSRRTVRSLEAEPPHVGRRGCPTFQPEAPDTARTGAPARLFQHGIEKPPGQERPAAPYHDRQERFGLEQPPRRRGGGQDNDGEYSSHYYAAYPDYFAKRGQHDGNIRNTTEIVTARSGFFTGSCWIPRVKPDAGHQPLERTASFDGCGVPKAPRCPRSGFGICPERLRPAPRNRTRPS